MASFQFSIFNSQSNRRNRRLKRQKNFFLSFMRCRLSKLSYA